MSENQAPKSIADFYAGNSLFVTGASGFIGKVLVEKLLSSCPGIDKIYLLIRSSRDGSKTPAQRLKEDIIQSRVFQLRKEQKYDFSKLVAVGGDMTKPRLGLSDEDYKTLTDNVSLVFHSAATVRFHGPLKKFIHQNVLGTESLMKLARDMKKLKTVVYVSTAYANCNLLNVEERIYPLVDDVQVLIDDILAKDSDETPLPGHPTLMDRPNSYTISKAIAESLIQQKFSDVPVVLCRPSIVTHAFQQPAEGWCDSLNGLAGTLLLGGLGIARTMEINCDYKADIIPVDFVANALIVVGYHHSLAKPEERKPVVHITSGSKNPITWAQILNWARMSALKKPSTKMIRPIASNPLSSKTRMGRLHYQIIKFFSHILFAYIFDFILLILRKKRIMVDVTQKMHRAFDVLEHFTNRQWLFENDNYIKIIESLPLEEQENYASNVKSIDWIQYCDTLYMGIRRYMLNEDDSTIEAGIKKQKRLIIIYGALQYLIYSLIALALGFCFRNFLIST